MLPGSGGSAWAAGAAASAPPSSASTSAPRAAFLLLRAIVAPLAGDTAPTLERAGRVGALPGIALLWTRRPAGVDGPAATGVMEMQRAHVRGGAGPVTAGLLLLISTP